MALYKISPEKEAALLALMAKLGVYERDLEEQFVKGSGAGGQKRNKTSNAVVIKHRPSGIEVRCGRERSQSTNRFLARRLLCEELSKSRR